ncbi:MAG: outer membrane beta-barrel protein [Flavobacteriales bacterium]|nr:outer membrane beta-barrel protein [Flavobacteriales bacterium]
MIDVALSYLVLQTPDGFTTLGYSLGFDMQVIPDAFIRFEGRTFHGTEKYFESTFGPAQDNTSVTVSMSVRF